MHEFGELIANKDREIAASGHVFFASTIYIPYIII